MKQASYDLVVTLGTDHHRFDRLRDWTVMWHASHPEFSVLIQRGFTPEHSKATLHQSEFMGHDELLDLLSRAKAAVSHGGPGSIFDCRSAGLLPVVVPRDPAMGEHVDSHQILFSRRLKQAGLIDNVQTFEAFEKALENALLRERRQLHDDDKCTVAETAHRLGHLVSTALDSRRTNAARRRRPLVGHRRDTNERPGSQNRRNT